MNVLLVDDSPEVRTLLRALLETEPDVTVVGDCGDGAAAVRLAADLQPDLVLMDVLMPGMDGVAATRIITQAAPGIRVVGLSVADDADTLTAMVAAGAVGYLLKSSSHDEIRAAVHAVAAGRPVIAPESLALLLDDLGRRYREERERAEGLAEIDRLKRTFISLVSDQLRNPITSISGHARTLQRGWDVVDDATKLEFLAGIEQQAERLRRLVEQILTVTAIQRGEMSAVPAVFSLDDVARQAVDQFTERMLGRSLALDLAPVLVAGDRMGTVAVAIALVENAVEHTSGAVFVRVARRGSVEALLEVRDEGGGIDADAITPMLDRPFIAGDQSNTRSAGGLGLSLYIAKQVIEAVGGSLELTADAAGSTFRAVLPAVGDEADALPPTAT